jgi:hypothetical protein
LFWEYTQGIAHIAVALFYLSQVRAVVAGRESIDRAIVTKVYQEELAMMHPMIAALRSGREETILQYADLDIPRAALRIHSAQQDAPNIPDEQGAGIGTQSSKQARLVAILVQMGIGEDIAPIVAEQALEERPNEDLFSLVAHIKNLEDKTTAQPATKANPQKKEKLRPMYVEDDLRLIRDDDPEETYQSLRKRGVIIEISAYL